MQVYLLFSSKSIVYKQEIALTFLFVSIQLTLFKKTIKNYFIFNFSSSQFENMIKGKPHSLTAAEVLSACQTTTVQLTTVRHAGVSSLLHLSFQLNSSVPYACKFRSHSVMTINKMRPYVFRQGGCHWTGFSQTNEGMIYGTKDQPWNN